MRDLIKTKYWPWLVAVLRNDNPYILEDLEDMLEDYCFDKRHLHTSLSLPAESKEHSAEPQQPTAVTPRRENVHAAKTEKAEVAS